MNKLLKLFFAISTMAILFTSCGKNNGIGNMIPSDALFVAQANMKSLESKLSWNDIKQNEWYKKAFSDSSTPEWRRKILDNPTASGIDFDEGLIFFAAKNPQSGYYIAVEGKLKSEKDFEQFNINFDSTQKVRKEGDINLLTLKDRNVVGWNSDHFIYIMNPETTSSQLYKWGDSSSIQPSAPADNSTQLSELCKKLFSLKSDSSLAKNDKFNALLKENGDIHVWQNNEALVKSAPSMGMLGMLKIDAFIKDNISTYSVNFDNGKVEMDQKMYVSKELYDIIKKYTGSSVNMDMIKNIPSQNVIGLLAMNFKPQGLTEMIKLTGADGLVNTYSQQMGFGLDDVSKATNGDLLLAFTDFKMKGDSGVNSNEQSMNFRNLSPDFNYIFSVGIGDKPSLQKITDAVTKVSSQFGKDSMVNYVMNDKIFAQSNTNAFAKQYLAGNNNKYDFADKFSGHPFAFFLDIHKLLTGFSELKDDSNGKKEMLDESLKMWNNIISYGGDFKDNAIRVHSEVNMINKDTNSLKQLNDYINKMYTLDQKNKSESTTKLDSLLTPPPIDTVKVK